MLQPAVAPRNIHMWTYTHIDIFVHVYTRTHIHHRSFAPSLNAPSRGDACICTYIYTCVHTKTYIHTHIYTVGPLRRKHKAPSRSRARNTRRYQQSHNRYFRNHVFGHTRLCDTKFSGGDTKVGEWYSDSSRGSIVRYGVATISRLLKIISLFCRIYSLL